MELQNLKQCLESIREAYRIPGLDCIVYKDHEMIFRSFLGFRDIEQGKKMQGDELYLIFSMTKMLTCVSALQLWEKGKYDLDDPVSMYLSEFGKMRISDAALDVKAAAKITSGAMIGGAALDTENGYAKNPITVRHLFSMSGGLHYNLNCDAIKEAKTAGKTTTREFVSAIAETVLGFEPGTRFRYSLCHDVLGALIEVWSGQKFGDYMKAHILEPLGMQHTFFGLPKTVEDQTKMAALYSYNSDGEPRKVETRCQFNLSTEYESGGAGLTSCAEDYAIFLDALACGGIAKNGARILHPETIALMKTNQLCEQAYEDFQSLRHGYGYGLGVRTHVDKAVSGALSPIGEFGWDGAAGAFSMVDTENKLSMAYFQHAHNWDADMHMMLRNALYENMEAFIKSLEI